MKTKKIKVYAVALSVDDNFIPAFNVAGFGKSIMQIHSDKKSAEKFVKNLKNNDWVVLECELIVPMA